MKKVIVFSALLVMFTACERQSREFAGSPKPPLGTPEFQVVANMHSVDGLTYIQEVAPGDDKGPDGEKLYAANCSACHQVTGQGIPNVFPPLAASKYVTGDTARLAAIMVYGLKGPINVNGSVYNGVMAPLGHLKDEELAAIATYVRSAWSNAADPVEAQVIADARTKWGTRGQFEIRELGEES